MRYLKYLSALVGLIIILTTGEAYAKQDLHRQSTALSQHSVRLWHGPRHHHHLKQWRKREGSIFHSDGRPSAWCGWWMRHHVASDPGPQFNLAANWSHYGTPASGPGPGVIGVLPHHVFMVTEVLGDHRVMAISGNDRHSVRTRPRSTSGVIAWRKP